MADNSILRVRVHAQQRVALGVGSEVSYFTGTHSYVPGSVLRGALAAAWIVENGPPPAGAARAARFRDLFDGRNRYGPLHVTGSSIVPVSAWLCKYPKSDACSAQAVDVAFETATACVSCGGPLVQGKGQVVLPDGVRLDRITRTSIDPGTAKAADGELYAHAALPEGITLSGVIYGRDPWLEQPRTLRLGGRRTVGGAVDYSVIPAKANAPNQPLSADGHLIIRLTGPAVFVDAAARPSLGPDPSLDLNGATVARSWVRPATWAGWHAASRLPKPEELCAAVGSTYKLSGPPEILHDLAERLPRDGAGLRRAEGFGEIEVVTSPWRPSPPAVSTQPQHDADVASRDWHRRIQAIELDSGLQRWVVGALRALQLDLEGGRLGEETAGRSLADELLARPGAGEFSGRQRDLVIDLFTEPDPQVLRDVTTLLLADLPAAEDPREG